MNGITDIFKSERGIISLALLIGATVLTAVSKMTVDQWQHFAVLVLGIYVAGKTVTGAVALWSGPATAESNSTSDLISAGSAMLAQYINSAQAAQTAKAAAASGIPGAAPTPNMTSADLIAAAAKAHAAEAQAAAAKAQVAAAKAQLDSMKDTTIESTP